MHASLHACMHAVERTLLFSCLLNHFCIAASYAIIISIDYSAAKIISFRFSCNNHGMLTKDDRMIKYSEQLCLSLHTVSILILFC